MTKDVRYSVLLEMLRSYVTLARTLNLTQTIETLGTTRQTVRRHIRALERLKGAKLLELVNQKYRVTEAGQAYLKDAEDLLHLSKAWLDDQPLRLDRDPSLDYARYQDDKGHDFYCQQHRLNRIWEDSPPLMRDALAAWVSANALIDDPALDPVRPYLIHHRWQLGNLLIAGIGPKSAYAIRFGSTWAKSAISCPVSASPVGRELREFQIKFYKQVHETGGARLDHVFVQIPRKVGGIAQPAGYQRLMFACKYPDGSPVVATLVVHTETLDIQGLDPKKIPKVEKRFKLNWQRRFEADRAQTLLCR